MSHSKVLFFSRDPGATNQLVAVHDLLCQSGPADDPAIQELRSRLKISDTQIPEAVILGKKFAHTVWNAAGIQAEEWTMSTVEQMAQFLRDRNIEMVITGTDDIDEPDTVTLWQAAQQIGLPVATFLDNLINLEVRFRTRDGQLVTPDLVFTLDTHSSEELRNAGIPDKNLRTTKNLHLARLTKLATANAGARSRLREEWQADESTQIILFASENTVEMAAQGRPAPWDEHALLQGVIETLAHGQSIGDIDPNKAPVIVVIRPHPRDTVGKYDRYSGNTGPKVLISKAGNPLEAALAADLVVGMDSALLFESDALGRPALSLVPDSKFNQLAGSKH